MVLAVGLPELPPADTVLKPSPEVPPGKIVREVTETTHIKVKHSHNFDVSSYVLTSETVREKDADDLSNVESKQHDVVVPIQMLKQPQSFPPHQESFQKYQPWQPQQHDYHYHQQQQQQQIQHQQFQQYQHQQLQQQHHQEQQQFGRMEQSQEEKSFSQQFHHQIQQLQHQHHQDTANSEIYQQKVSEPMERHQQQQQEEDEILSKIKEVSDNFEEETVKSYNYVTTTKHAIKSYF